ncbi:MAG: hypothetical protein K8H88_10360 [Sandaracinaceae bacterium]|nr:hypothetical protein [Sandaracinaceae bacterium]
MGPSHTLLALLALLALGCSAPAEQATAQPQTGPTSAAPATPDGWRWTLPAGAPDPLSCSRNEDCVVEPYPYSPSGCCAAFAAPMTRAFASWYAAWIAQHCTGGRADCTGVDLPGAPSPPAPCYFEPRCNEGRCGSGC